MVKRETEFDFVGGIEITYEFDNGYVASVSCTRGTYGGPKGLFELAVLKDGEFVEPEFMGGNTVMGWLDFGKVAELLKLVEALPNPDLKTP
jgi:hypothetical protein